MKYLNPRKKLVNQIRDIAARCNDWGMESIESDLLSICHELLKVRKVKREAKKEIEYQFQGICMPPLEESWFYTLSQLVEAVNKLSSK
jgi:hypothetical protein